MNTSPQTPPFQRTLAAIAILVGISIPLRASGVATEQAALGLAFLAALSVLVRSPQSREWFKQCIAAPQTKAIAVIFIAWALTIYFSFNPMGSLKIGARSGIFIVLSIAIGSVLYKQHGAQRILWKAIIISAVILTFFTVLSLNGVPFILSAFEGRLITNARPELLFKAYGAAAMSLIPVVSWAGYKLGQNWRWSGFVFIPLALIVIVMTSNRSALAGFLAMTTVATGLMIISNRRYIKTIFALSTTLILGLVTWLYNKETLLVSSKTYLKPIANSYLPDWLVDPHRQNIWRFAYDRFLDHPWVGNGIDQLNYLPGANDPVPGLQKFAAMVPSHPHNWMLEILSETGLIGFIPVFFALGFVAWTLFKSYHATHNPEDLTRLLLMVGFWTSALFNFSIWATWWQLTFYMLFAIVSCSREHPHDVQTNRQDL